MKAILIEMSGLLNIMLGVVIGVLASLAAAYLKPLLDALLAKFSTTIRNKNARLKADWEKEVQRLASNGAVRAEANSAVHTNFLLAIHLLLGGVLVISFTLFLAVLSPESITDSPRFYGLGLTLVVAFAFALSMRRLYRGNRVLRLLSEAESKRSQQEQTSYQL